MSALLLDCDGVLADTERDGHLVAFNAMFEELDLPVRWSSDDYAGLLRIGGGKERLATLLDDQAVWAAAGSPATAEERQDVIASWHRAKTRIFTELVARGAVPPRPGVRRLILAALDAGWTVAVASTSAPESVGAVLAGVVGPEVAASIPVFAGDVVAHKKPDPAVYLHALAELGLTPAETVVIEDSRNGFLASSAAGLRTVVTVSGYTQDEDFTGAALVVSSLGDPDGEAVTVLADPSDFAPSGAVTLSDLEQVLAQSPTTAAVDSWADVDFVVTTVARTCVENERYFGELDAVVGDGDLGYSLARGFEKLQAQYSELKRADVGTFLKQVGMLLTSRIGGTSGPIWGTGFIRAGMTAGDTVTVTGTDVVAMFRAAIAGIEARGGAQVGDKTLLDCLVPMTDEIERAVGEGAGSDDIVARAALTARSAAEATAGLVAKRGRASYTGERSRGSVDAGAVVVAVIVEQIASGWKTRETR